jgi:hypothetical protein
METPVRVFCLSWNVGGMSFCRDTSKGESGLSAFFNRVKCNKPGSIEDILRLQLNEVQIVLISTEDELSDSTYLHSNFLPLLMNEMGYRRLTTSKASGDGEFSRRISLTSDLVHTALRLSVYINLSEPNIKLSDDPLTRISLMPVNSSYAHHMSGISVTLVIRDRPVRFIAVGLGSGTPTIDKRGLLDVPVVPHVVIEQSRSFITAILDATMNAGYTFIMGDFGVPVDTVQFDQVVPNAYHKLFNGISPEASVIFHDAVLSNTNVSISTQDTSSVGPTGRSVTLVNSSVTPRNPTSYHSGIYCTFDLHNRTPSKIERSRRKRRADVDDEIHSDSE